MLPEGTGSVMDALNLARWTLAILALTFAVSWPRPSQAAEGLSVVADTSSDERTNEVVNDGALEDAAREPGFGPATGLSEFVVAPEPSPEALAFYHGSNWLWGLRWLMALALPAVLLFTGYSAQLRNVAQRIGRRPLFTAIVFGWLFLLLTFLVEFPVRYYQGYVRLHEYGLSNQTFARWAENLGKMLAVETIAATLIVAGLYLLLRFSPQRWWLYTWLLSLPIMFTVALILPVWIQPLFNDFQPLADRELDAKILNLASRAGIDDSRVFQVNKSADTKAVNAYVTGFGNTKRIVLWDTLLNRLTERQVLFVVAHEMGHYVLGHVWKTLAAVFGLLLVALWLINWACQRIIARWSNRLGFDRLSDPAALPLLLLAFQVCYLLFSPPALALSRYHEREADRFALELTQWNRDGAEGFVRLQQENLSVPTRGWLYQFFRGTHPTLAERIEFCNCYRPWEVGEPLRYGDLFGVPEQALPAAQR
jgi:STE24 endopeptidase